MGLPKITFKQVMLEPGDYFKSPEDLCRYKDFSLDQKIKILRMWAYDAHLEQPPEAGNKHAKKDVMLDRILTCLFRLARKQKTQEKH